MDFRRSIVAVAVILLTLMLLGGFYVKNLVFWIRWAEYLSFITYSYDAALYFEFTPDNYFMYVMLDLLYLTYKVYTWPYQITISGYHVA